MSRRYALEVEDITSSSLKDKAALNRKKELLVLGADYKGLKLEDRLALPREIKGVNWPRGA